MSSGLESPPDFHRLDVTAMAKFPLESVNPLATRLLVDWKYREMPAMPMEFVAASTSRPEILRVAGMMVRLVVMVAPALRVNTGELDRSVTKLLRTAQSRYVPTGALSV